MHKLRFLAIVFLSGLLFSGCLLKKKQKPLDASASAEPDKVLYNKALEDISHNRHEVARLTLQTLINTYPDSEYLAKAKLAIADSFYKEGGVSGLKQSVEEYNNFIIFFPFLDEAAYAQMQIGLAHYRQLEKPDRDRTSARLAEDAFQVFIQKYPNSPLIPQAVQKLRDVQELLAEGDFRIAHYYYVKGSLRASGARLLDLTTRYPLYSQADKANWMLGQIFERAEKGDVAARFYARILREYPLSELSTNAKERLVKLGVPVPQADPEALARQQQEREIDRGGGKSAFLKKPLALIHSGPDVKSAARYGQPNLTPASEAIGSLPEGPMSPGPGMSVSGTATTGTGSNSPVVATVVPGTTAGSAPPPSTEGSTTNPPTDPGAASAPGTQPSAPNPSTDPNAKPAPDPCKADPKAKPDDKNKKPDDKSKKDCKESTSKKKTGIKKIIPW
jgi:outer membrane protein assembly factor BamD